MELFLLEEYRDQETKNIIGVFTNLEKAKEFWNEKTIQSGHSRLFNSYFIYKIESDRELDWDNLNILDAIEPELIEL